MARNLTELDHDDECGCGSGAPYSACCKGQEFIFEKDEKGRVFRSAPIAPELIETLREMRSEFKSIFGRFPSKGDRFFLGGFLESGAEIDRQFEKMAEEIDLPPQLLYAYRQTGRIVSERNSKLLTKAELQEWNDAVSEYLEAEELGIDLLNPPSQIAINEELKKVILVLRASVIHFGSYVTRIRRNKRLSTAKLFQAIAFSRCHELVNSFFKLMDDEPREEVFLILRALYECYVIIIYLEAKPEASDELAAQHLVGRGGYRFLVRADGLADRRKIVDPKGQTFRSHTSMYEMAKASPLSLDLEFFDFAYEKLSQHAHFDLNVAFKYVQWPGIFEVNKINDFYEAVLFGLCLVKMVADASSHVALHTVSVKRDARYLANMTREAFRSYLNALKAAGAIATNDIDVIESRINAILPGS